MVDRKVLLEKKKFLELKKKQQKEAFELEKGKVGKKGKRRKRAPVPSDEIDYGWCPPLGDEPIIKIGFKNKKIIAVYTNKKRVR